MNALNGMNPNDLKLSDLYQEVILDHNKRPRNFGKLAKHDHSAHGKNPLCGDDYFLYLSVDGSGNIEKVGFEGSGCAISKASASMMTTYIKGKQIREAQQIKDAFLELLTEEIASDPAKEKIGRMIIFEGVKEFPVRVKCATLIWHALADALKDAG